MLKFNYKIELSNYDDFSKRSSCSSTKSKDTFPTTIMQLQISLKKYIKFSKNSIGWLAQKTSECGMWNVECGMWNVECGTWNVKFFNTECEK